METIVNHFPYVKYSPQATIHLNNSGNKLSVSAGGTLSNNKYTWFKNGKRFFDRIGDSTFSPTENGTYYVKVTNAVATKLTLYSDTINYSVSDNLIAAQINNKLSSVSLYPNPAKANATLSFNTNGKYSITITDVSGKVLQTKAGVAIKGTNIIQLDVSKYASGLYLVTITDGKNRKQILRLNKE